MYKYLFNTATRLRSKSRFNNKNTTRNTDNSKGITSSNSKTKSTTRNQSNTDRITDNNKNTTRNTGNSKSITSSNRKTKRTTRTRSNADRITDNNKNTKQSKSKTNTNANQSKGKTNINAEKVKLKACKNYFDIKKPYSYVKIIKTDNMIREVRDMIGEDGVVRGIIRKYHKSTPRCEYDVELTKYNKVLRVPKENLESWGPEKRTRRCNLDDNNDINAIKELLMSCKVKTHKEKRVILKDFQLFSHPDKNPDCIEKANDIFPKLSDISKKYDCVDN